VVKVAGEGGESRSQVKLFFTSACPRLLIKFALLQSKPLFCVRQSANEQPFFHLMYEGLLVP
jgi:hypothetical protein